jgi:hypothetical protein
MCYKVLDSLFSILLTECIYVFHMVMRTFRYYFCIQNNLLDCVIEKECVYCAVRAKHLNVIQFDINLKLLNWKKVN